MSRGVFSAEFTDVFGDVLGDIFDVEFPSYSGRAPDPKSSAQTPDFVASLPSDLPTDQFEFATPDHAADAAPDDAPGAPASSSLSAVIADYGPLLAPGGNGGGKPGGDDGPGGGGPGGGGKPGGDKGGNTLHAEWVSGDGSSTTIPDPFNIEVELYGDAGFWDSELGVALELYLKAASDFISEIVAYGFADDPLMFHSYDEATRFEVDDLLVEVYVQEFKGRNSGTIAAETEIFAANDFNGGGLPETPAGATITFNLNLMANLETLGVLDDTVLHEMLHTLGFGLWETADNDLTTTTGGQITYTGDGATGKIVENEGLVGSVGGHWAESVYDEELMTSIVETTDNMYLADFSILTLADLAVVDVDVDVDGTNLEGYTLSADWQNQLAALNATGDVDGIDLGNWVIG